MYLLDFNLEFSLVLGAILLNFIMVGWLLKEFVSMRNEIRDHTGISNETLKLQLQAYERLTLFAERAGLRNMVSRANFSDQGVGTLHAELIEQIKSEYEYNVSQQIYVSKEVWNAVTKLKDQNIYIVNQLASTLPHHATGLDLSKRILEYSLTDKAELNVIVLDALQYEAKKIMT